MVGLTPADVSDSAGAFEIAEAMKKRWPWLGQLFADGAYDRVAFIDKAAFHDVLVDIVRKIEGQKGFEVLPRRWVVERTFGWLMRWRRLVRGYESCVDVSAAMIDVAAGSLLLRRVSHP